MEANSPDPDPRFDLDIFIAYETNGGFCPLDEGTVTTPVEIRPKNLGMPYGLHRGMRPLRFPEI